MKELTLQEMEAILGTHETAELAEDIDATMETVAPDPHYEFPIPGWTVDGDEGVRVYYGKLLVDGAKWNVASRKRAHGTGPNTLFREAWISYDDEKGTRRTGQYMAVIEFDPETRTIKSERHYGDAVFGAFLPAIDACDPGVSRINANTKPVTREEMLGEIRILKGE